MLDSINSIPTKEIKGKTAEEIIKGVTFHNSPSAIKDHLHCMFLSFLLLDDDKTHDFLSDVIGSYRTLYDALTEMEEYEKERINSIQLAQN